MEKIDWGKYAEEVLVIEPAPTGPFYWPRDVEGLRFAPTRWMSLEEARALFTKSIQGK